MRDCFLDTLFSLGEAWINKKGMAYPEGRYIP